MAPSPFSMKEFKAARNKMKRLRSSDTPPLRGWSGNVKGPLCLVVRKRSELKDGFEASLLILVVEQDHRHNPHGPLAPAAGGRFSL